METCYILDASAFINGFQITSNRNYTVPEITAELKDFESRLRFDEAVNKELIRVKDVYSECIIRVNNIISVSGDSLRLSLPDVKLIALAYMLSKQGETVKVITDDYSIQNALKIMNIPYSGVLTEGIKEIYNWKKVCEGCKKEFDDSYPFDDCEICGSKIFKKRIRVKK
ncbi:MAG: ribonuclease VapC [Methanobrevibacter sp.]|uniref:ribonuclease VapC n=1 Tax=Methanobrevibacter sp. TaxID=66852 RepID=UPI0025EC3C55|nr:ribonuclease VapC [Methanobrevibacter sp.]MBQ6098484.1 ribonuclease VapC [Methanobrevibacter sp.]